jgi:tetratricopeptide (TPR) repeat protein
MKALPIACLFAATLIPLLLCAQDEVPLGDVARNSKAEREALRKAHPNVKAHIWEEDGAITASAAWDTGSDPTGAREIVDRGLELDHQGRFDEALGEYTKVLKLRPDYARAYYDIGVVKDEQGKTSEAIAAYKQAIALDETHFQCFENLGKVLIDAGQYVASEDVLRTGLRLFPDNLGIMLNLGNAVARQRRFDEAISYFRRILDVAPERNDARQNLCYSLLQLGRSDEADKVRAEGLKFLITVHKSFRGVP